jgi:cytochrome b subunit of formate dehydrogenase
MHSHVIVPTFPDTFGQSVLWSGLIVLLVMAAFAGMFLWAQYREYRETWEKQGTRKLKAVRR